MDNTLFKQWIGSSAKDYEFDKDMPRFSYNDMLAFGAFVASKSDITSQINEMKKLCYMYGMTGLSHMVNNSEKTIDERIESIREFGLTFCGEITK